MTDQELAQYLPHHGDRLAIGQFCKHSATKNKTENRKQTLFDTLRKKLKLGVTDHKATVDLDSEKKTRHVLRKEKMIGNDNAKKDKRRVDMGWIVKEENSAKQVRTRLGGGTRKLIVSKELTKCDLIKEGKQLFFLHGMSQKGSELDFDFDIWDFAENPIEDNVSVNELYDISKLSTLRLYLATTRKCIPIVADDSLEESPQKRLKFNCKTPEHTDCDLTDETTDDAYLPDPKLSEDNNVMQSASAKYIDILSTAVEYSGINLEKDELEGNVDFLDAVAAPNGNDLETLDPDFIAQELVVTTGNISTLTNNFPVPVFSSSPISETTVTLTNNFNESNATATVQSSEENQQDNNTIQFGPFPSSEDLDDTLPYFGVPTRSRRSRESTTDLGNRKSITVVVHEGKIMHELISFFKEHELINADITIQRFRPLHGEKRSEHEAGAGLGMIRDVLTEFWTEFYERCTSGCSVKVPITRHDFQEEEWKAVSRIILKGWLDFGYFPVGIAPTILEECIYGKLYSNVLDTFFQYLPSSDAVTLKTACENFYEIDHDDLVDVLSSHNGRIIPTENNVKAICIEIAKKELVHDPRFVVDMWKEVLTPLSEKLPLSEFQGIYKSLIPTTKKILALLSFPDVVSGGQSDTILYLKKFIKEMELEILKSFVRFCTGSDLLVKDVDCIKVTFCHLEGLSRRPVAHTCGCVLELSDNYVNFPEFRAEFNAVLRSGIWTMDIV